MAKKVTALGLSPREGMRVERKREKVRTVKREKEWTLLAQHLFVYFT
jgi:hypothetical protein